MKFYQTPEFKKIDADWAAALEDAGFVDLERVSEPDRRTLLWDNREIILDFFLCLDHLMTNYPEMPEFERRVMTLFSSGTRINEIVRQTRASRKGIYNIIVRYKNLVNLVQKIKPITHFPLSIRPQSNQVLEDGDEQRSIRDPAA